MFRGFFLFDCRSLWRRLRDASYGAVEAVGQSFVQSSCAFAVRCLAAFSDVHGRKGLLGKRRKSCFHTVSSRIWDFLEVESGQKSGRKRRTGWWGILCVHESTSQAVFHRVSFLKTIFLELSFLSSFSWVVYVWLRFHSPHPGMPKWTPWTISSRPWTMACDLCTRLRRKTPNDTLDVSSRSFFALKSM